MSTDWEVLSCAKNGDDKAAEIIFNKYKKPIIRMTALIIGSLDSAKDIYQETFLRLINGKIRHHEGNFKTYITTIAYRLALKEKYRINKTSQVDSEEFLDTKISPVEEQISEETQKKIFTLINSLPLNQKEILVLRFYGGHSYEEISEITKLPIGTVKSRIFYAVKACGKKIKQTGVI